MHTMPVAHPLWFLSRLLVAVHVGGVLQRNLVIFGRTVAQPRLIAYMADPDTPPYTYSGLTLQPMPWAEVGVSGVCHFT